MQNPNKLSLLSEGDEEKLWQAKVLGDHSPQGLLNTIMSTGVDEQTVMERTGHRSLEGVRTYKHTSKQQRAAILDIFNLKKQCLESSDHTQQQAAHTTVNNTCGYSQDTAHAFYFNVSSCGTVNIYFNSHH